MKDYKEIAGRGFTGALKSGAIAGAGSIISGVGLAVVPVKILGLFAVGTSVVVAAPVVAGVVLGGAAIGGTFAAYSAYRKQVQIEKQFALLTKHRPDDESDEPPVPAGTE
jgi:hypothetical protein